MRAVAAEVPPGLTTIRAHGYQIGWAAADMLIARIEGEPAGGPVRNLGYALVPRASA